MTHSLLVRGVSPSHTRSIDKCGTPFGVCNTYEVQRNDTWMCLACPVSVATATKHSRTASCAALLKRSLCRMPHPHTLAANLSHHSITQRAQFLCVILVGSTRHSSQLTVPSLRQSSEKEDPRFPLLQHAGFDIEKNIYEVRSIIRATALVARLSPT